jgi:hypothetical protein
MVPNFESQGLGFFLCLFKGYMALDVSLFHTSVTEFLKWSGVAGVGGLQSSLHYY